MPSITTKTADGNTWVDGLAWGTIWATNTFTYSFATTAAHQTYASTNDATTIGGTYNALGTTGIDASIRSDVRLAFDMISAVSGLSFTENTAAASFGTVDFKILAFNNLTSGSTNVNGSATFPGTDLFPGSTTNYESFNYFNSSSSTMTTNPTAVSDSSNRLHTIIHEFGHSLGLLHPHEPVGGNAWTTGNNTGAGESVLDNDRYTVMSAERGGLDMNEQSLGFGYSVTPMALDIASLHHLYGSSANHTGNTVYKLLDSGSTARDLYGDDGSVAIGRAFYSIWDTGGNDEIQYSGSQHILINLNEATLSATDTAELTAWINEVKASNLYTGLATELQNDISLAAWHAGGFLSRIYDDNGNAQLGGFSIANAQNADTAHQAGAVIENATGGNKSDVLIGNEQDNILKGNGGDDLLHGSAGRDTLEGNAGDDQIFGGAGDDIAIYSGSCSEYTLVRNSDGTVTIQHISGTQIDNTDTLTGVEEAQFSDGKFHIDGEVFACLPTDLVFLQDLSGSFSNDLPNMQSAISGILSQTSTILNDVRYGVTTLRDNAAYSVDVNLTTNTSSIVNAYAGFTATGDEEEAQLEALISTVQDGSIGYRAGVQKIIVVSTDEPYDDSTFDDHFVAVATLKSALEATNAIPIFAVTSNLVSTYQSLVDLLGRGAVVTITSDSANFADAIRASVAKVTGELTELGTSGNDALNGTDDRNDGIFGGLGNDTINGGGGDDTVDGGADDDTLSGGSGNDKLVGGSGDDDLDGGADLDTLYGGIGSDRLDGGAGANDIASYFFSSAGVVINLGSGMGFGGDAEGDTLINIEEVFGSNYDDILSGDGVANALYGGDGYDVLYGSVGGDYLDGGAGDRDIASYFYSASGVNVNLGSGLGFGGEAEGDRLVNVEDIYGSNYDDILSGDGLANALYGDEGRDVLYGSAGGDYLDGGAGANDIASYFFSNAGVNVNLGSGIGVGGEAEGDRLVNIEEIFGSNYDDVLSGNAFNNALYGADGSDALYGSAGADYLDGGAGSTDIASYYYSSGGVIVNLGSGLGTGAEADGDILVNIEQIYGSNYNDILSGDGFANALFGSDGYDILYGSAGGDYLDGGAGAQDIASYYYSTSGVIVNLGSGLGFGGEAEGDTLINIEEIYGSTHNDILSGDGFANALYGDAGVDALYGSAGGDHLDGGAGAFDIASYYFSTAGVAVNLAAGVGFGGEAAGDTLVNIEQVYGSAFADTLSGDGFANVLFGGAGNDSLWGAGGNDTLVGGAGHDTYLIGVGGGADRVEGFSAGGSTEDVIDVSAFGFTDINDIWLRYTQVGSDVVIALDATTQITIADTVAATLHSDDFLF